MPAERISLNVWGQNLHLALVAIAITASTSRLKDFFDSAHFSTLEPNLNTMWMVG